MRRYILALFAILSAPAMAEDTRLVTMTTGQNARGWEAVGRLDIAAKGFCSAVLIAEDQVLTAAHCVFDDNGPIDPARFTFMPGLREGRAEAYRNVRKAVAHPAYNPDEPTSWKQVAHDIALLQLDRPIRNSRIRPFGIAASPSAGEEIGLVSYARDRAEAPSLQEVCEVIAHQDNLVVMTCDVDYGSSGAPVFRITPSGAEVVSIVSAMSEMEGRKVSVGTSLDQPLAELVAHFNTVPVSMNGGLPRVINPGQRNDTGAKFVTTPGQ